MWQVSRFLSTANSFNEPLGSHIRPGEVHGYYVDLRVKAREPGWRPGERREPGSRVWVYEAQKALGSYERFIAGDGEQWLRFAQELADTMITAQQRGGRHDGGFVHNFDFPHTFPLRGPWLSAMAQGEAASLFVRLRRATGDERYADAALRALRPLAVPSADGGVAALLDGRPFPEEYPTSPPSFVLNGGIFAIWGVHDVAVALDDGEHRETFEALADTLADNIQRWDLGYWSRYDLFPHPAVNVASAAYHTLHTDQLRAFELIAPRPQLTAARERFERYAASRACALRAFAGKVAFRARVSRRRAPAGS